MPTIPTIVNTIVDIKPMIGIDFAMQTWPDLITKQNRLYNLTNKSGFDYYVC